MTLCRGVFPVFFNAFEYDSIPAVNKAALECFLERVTLQAGDTVLLTKGDIAGVEGGTNTMKILQVPAQ